ncbi:MAG: hypothetical protein R2734_21505 [Nocardioides sp.]
MAALIAIAVVWVAPLVRWRRVARVLRPALLRLARLVPRRRRPEGRALEEIAWHARRLSVAVRTHPRGISFVKYEAHRRAYDGVLAEACQALGITHLLGVLPPSPELDRERARVERALECAGLELGLPLS